MKETERKELIENMAQKYVGLDERDKSFIAGYMTGKQEERQKWEQKKAAVV